MKGMKKWFFGVCLLVVLAAFLSVPALMSTDTETRLADDPVAKRAALDRELAEMRAEMKANGWDFQIGANPAMQYSIEQLCNFKPELKPLNSSAYEPGDQAVVAATLPTAFMGVASSIKNQASCGSCWAFSTIAGLEAAIMWNRRPGIRSFRAAPGLLQSLGLGLQRRLLRFRHDRRRQSLLSRRHARDLLPLYRPGFGLRVLRFADLVSGRLLGLCRRQQLGAFGRRHQERHLHPWFGFGRAFMLSAISRPTPAAS